MATRRIIYIQNKGKGAVQIELHPYYVAESVFMRYHCRCKSCIGGQVHGIGRLCRQLRTPFLSQVRVRVTGNLDDPIICLAAIVTFPVAVLPLLEEDLLYTLQILS